MSNASATNRSDYRILLVEENADLAEWTLRLFQSVGMNCRHTVNVQNGMAMFNDWQPHIALLSLGLPRLGGVVLCPQIRQVSGIPIAILSVRTRREDQLHALNLGADDFIMMRDPDEQILMGRILTLLRRTYSYDSQNLATLSHSSQDEALQSPKPAGWATCEACDYMGPQRRFEKELGEGQRSNICPHCGATQSVRFGLV